MAKVIIRGLEGLRKKPREEDITEGINRTLEQLRNRIAVWSAKGGVGKTTFAINLAMALARKGKTGLLDADIDCPNIISMLGLDKPILATGNKLNPITYKGIEIVSMGAITKETVFWRGPMISGAISQFLNMVDWKSEILVVDMPPGTHDAALTIATILKPTSMIIITTPDESAIIDAEKSIKFAQKFGLNIAGIVENMSGEIFGAGNAKILAQKHKIKFLGSLPLDRKIREYVGKGIPLHETEFKTVFENVVDAVIYSKDLGHSL